MRNYLVDYVRSNEAAQLKDIQQELFEKFQVSLSTGYLSHVLNHEEGLVLTVGETRWMEHDPEKALRFRSFMVTEAIPHYGLDKLCFIDETSFDPRGLRVKRVRGPRGQRTIARRSGAALGKRYSVVAALTTSGIVHRHITSGTYNADLFWQFMIALLPQIPGYCIILDNARIHKDEERINNLSRIYDVRIVFLPPYSPFLNPIEVVFGQVKAYVATHFKEEGRLPSILHAFDLVKDSDILGLYAKHGYAL
ncbi:DDE superfamily endonuclease [Carpediemonas membranifera]|uniref:DDE superfamily endonuclease n=1 Tax=Carpediemonas membranifera TaxID=201153 RepID=A0A8J6DZZ9_9EUKA|nr:DDE superfamily endonuclease [Carpediemonas membranifera]|eukprot:KAG9394344.1 DDE superfamily endonuclease [Carpediemonas membranifera]